MDMARPRAKPLILHQREDDFHRFDRAPLQKRLSPFVLAGKVGGGEPRGLRLPTWRRRLSARAGRGLFHRRSIRANLLACAGPLTDIGPPRRESLERFARRAGAPRWRAFMPSSSPSAWC